MSGESELDREVGDLLEAGDSAGAAAATIRALGPELCGYLCAVLRSDDHGREVFAIACEQLLGSIGRFRGDSAVKTFAYRIGWRTAMRWKQDGDRCRVRHLATDEHSAIAQPVRDSTAAYRRTEAKDWLSQARASLAADDQSLLVLRLDRNMSWKQVAAIMADGDAAPEVARLRKRYERIKSRLRQLAERDGVIER